jgi:hypothetical protein
MEAGDLLNVLKGWVGRRRGTLPAAMAFVRICLANGSKENGGKRMVKKFKKMEKLKMCI